MFNFLKKKTEPASDAPSQQDASVSVLARLKEGLGRTRKQLGGGLARAVLGKKTIDASLLEAVETSLLTADVGISVSDTIVEHIKQQLDRKSLKDSSALFDQLRTELENQLTPYAQPLTIPEQNTPFVVLMVGINGSGKTTTIGKLAKRCQQAGKSVMLAAGDTFRAAAIEQLQAWGQRNEVPVIAQHSGADSASVIFDALQAATARGVDVLIADTAGRLHTQHHLMNELNKIVRVIQKIDSSAPHEVMLVLDAGTGQNALQQAKQFQQAVGVTGITLTKLDGTAKGGMLFALAHELSLPIRYIGVGEGLDDLHPFNAKAFVDALLSDAHDDSL